MKWGLAGAIACLGIGLAAFYFGFFHADAVCDDQSQIDWACHVQAAFTNESAFLLIGTVFVLLGLGGLYLILRKAKNTSSGPQG